MTAPAPLSATLEGCTIVIAADRRSAELSAALERHGARVWHAPALSIVPHTDDPALLAATRALVDDPPDVVIVTTGVGFRGWMEAAEEAGLRDQLQRALGRARFVVRGPKAHGAVQQAGFATDWVAASESASEVGDHLIAAGLRGARVAIQHHGSGADGLDTLCAAHGAEVIGLTVYRWGPPPDAHALRRWVRGAAAGAADAVLFTSAAGAAAWLAEARKEGVVAAITARSRTSRLLLAAVGPVTAHPLAGAGFTVTVADRGRLGALVRCVLGHYRDGASSSVHTPAGRLELRSGGAVLAGHFVPLTPTSAAVLALLVDARGGVVSRRTLQRALQRPGENTHAVDMAVARVRAALGAPGVVHTAVKRGYRLETLPSLPRQ